MEYGMIEEYDNKNWICIRASAEHAHLATLEAVMSMVDNALMIEDFSDVEKDLDGVYGDLIDEELLAKDGFYAHLYNSQFPTEVTK